MHLLSDSTGMIVGVAAFVVFFSVYKNSDAGCGGVLLGKWPTVSRKIIYFGIIVSYSAFLSTD